MKRSVQYYILIIMYLEERMGGGEGHHFSIYIVDPVILFQVT